MSLRVEPHCLTISIGNGRRIRLTSSLISTSSLCGRTETAASSATSAQFAWHQLVDGSPRYGHCELHIGINIAKTSGCLRVALVLQSLVRNAGNGKCGAASLSLVCLASLAHRTGRSALSEIPTLTSMCHPTNLGESADRRLMIKVSLNVEF